MQTKELAASLPQGEADRHSAWEEFPFFKDSDAIEITCKGGESRFANGIRSLTGLLAGVH